MSQTLIFKTNFFTWRNNVTESIGIKDTEENSQSIFEIIGHTDYFDLPRNMFNCMHTKVGVLESYLLLFDRRKD